jgi:phenylacetate-coenzyme A ligase PaaK-like adenylate-forming protein
MMSTKKLPAHEIGSGNIFADLGLPNAEEHQLKAALVVQLKRLIWDGSGLTDHAEKVTAYIKNTIGIGTQIKIVAPETLERSLGKAKRVVDKRPKT